MKYVNQLEALAIGGAVLLFLRALPGILRMLHAH